MCEALKAPMTLTTCNCCFIHSSEIPCIYESTSLTPVQLLSLCLSVTVCASSACVSFGLDLCYLGLQQVTGEKSGAFLSLFL